MTNYEAYIAIQKASKDAIKSINLSLGRNTAGEYDGNNDKHTLCIGVGEMGYGYYGSSSYYAIDNKLAKDYLNKACQSMKHKIGDDAIKLLVAECERFRKAAQDEAKQVLLEVGEVK